MGLSKNLIKNTHWNIFVKDLDKLKEKDLENNGALIAKNVNELYEIADMIITCLPGGDFVKDIYFGEQQIISKLKPNKLIVDMSTSQPDLMIEIKNQNEGVTMFNESNTVHTVYHHGCRHMMCIHNIPCEIQVVATVSSCAV